MNIKQVRTIHFAAVPNITFLELQTDTGLVGLGETFYTPFSVTAYLEEVLAPQLLNCDPLQIEAFWRRAYDGSHVYGNKGLEMRCLSAVDIALWDILGQHTGQPIWQILGGTSHPDGVLVYNTCATAGYAQGTPGIRRTKCEKIVTRYHDFEPWQKGGNAGKLAKSLLKMGIKGMKIWPFDPFAVTNRGQSISWREVDEGLRPWKQIRDAVGLDMEVILEGHGYWSLEPARRIAQALEPYKPALLEDVMKPDNPRTLAKLRESTKTPLCVSELLMNRYAVEEMMQANACDIVMTDVAWAGGITECRKIANMAETCNMGVIFHDCTGPVTLAAALHLAVHCPNTWMQEIVRSFTTSYYRDLVDHKFDVENSRMKAPGGAGLGVALRKDALKRKDCTVKVLD
ncbi:MAG: mandelate racemase/muconate lactonizing enzyme family protein [Verrucomicrobiae bacterium]|nr:mandelate racemase/muconate lactonizing enzyme family protein [Verrucomicrobiae bacterium]